MTRNRVQTVLLAAVVVLSAVAAAPALVGTAAASGSTTVSLAPTDSTVSVGGTTTYDVVVDPADGGVGAYNLSVSTDSSVATITDVEVKGLPQKVEYAADNSSVLVETFGADTADSGTATVATVTVSGEADGRVDLDLTVNSLFDESGASYDVTAVDDATVTVGDGGSGAAVGFAPQDRSVSPGSTTTYDVVVDPADGGVGAYNLSVSTDPSVATITDVEVKGLPQKVEYAADNSSVLVETFGADTADSGTATVATVTVTAQSAGTADLDLAVNALFDESGASYDIARVETGSVTVEAPTASIDVSYDVNRTSVEPGEAVAVTATVENAGDAEGTADVAFKTNAGTFATESVTVGANATETVTATTSFESAGTYEVYVDELPATTVTVESGNPFPSGVPGISGSAAPTDTQPSNPGYEDVNGDENAGFLDAVDFLFALEEVQSQSLTPEQRNALDFNDDGEIGFLDVVELLFRV